MKKSSFPPAFLIAYIPNSKEGLPLTGFQMRQYFQYYFYLGRWCEEWFLGTSFLFSRSCFEKAADSRLTTLVERFHKSFHKPKGFPLSFIVISISMGRSFSHGIFGDCDYNSKTLSFNIVGLFFPVVFHSAYWMIYLFHLKEHSQNIFWFVIKFTLTTDFLCELSYEHRTISFSSHRKANENR